MSQPFEPVDMLAAVRADKPTCGAELLSQQTMPPLACDWPATHRPGVHHATLPRLGKIPQITVTWRDDA